MKFKENITYHIIELHGPMPEEMVKWCVSSMGEQGRRWRRGYNTIYFENQRDHLLFTLKWS